MKGKRLGWFFLISLAGLVLAFSACRRKVSPEQWVREVKEKKVLTAHTAGIQSLAISPRGDLMASSDLDGKMIIWDLKTFERKKLVSFHDSQFMALAFSPQGKYLAGATRDKALAIYDTATLEVKTTAFDFPDMILALAWTGDDTLAGGLCETFDPRGWCTGSQIIIWKLGATFEEVRKFSAHQEYINALASSGDGKYLASGGSDRMILVWDPRSGSQVKFLSGHEGRINVLAFSGKEPNLLVSASLDGSVRLWNVLEDKMTNMLFGQQGEVYGMALSPDGNLIVSGGRDPKIIIWSRGTGDKMKELTNLSGQISALGFTPGGRELVAGIDDGKIVIFGP